MKTKQKELQEFVLKTMQTNLKIAELSLKAVTQKIAEVNRKK